MSTAIVSLNNGQQILQQSTLRFCLQQQFTTASKIPWKDAETLSERTAQVSSSSPSAQVSSSSILMAKIKNSIKSAIKMFLFLRNCKWSRNRAAFEHQPTTASIVAPPPIHCRLFSSVQSSNEPLASAAGDCKKDPRWHPCKMTWTRRETIKVYSRNYSEQNVNKKPKHLLKETLRKVLLRTHKRGSLTDTKKQGLFSWAHSVAQSYSSCCAVAMRVVKELCSSSSFVPPAATSSRRRERQMCTLFVPFVPLPASFRERQHK